jgi:hypothetical protein
MHRIKYTKLTPEQIVSKLAGAADGSISASPLSDVLARTSMKIVLDGGTALNYRFTDNRRLSFTEGDAAAVTAGYGALTLDRLVLFAAGPRPERAKRVERSDRAARDHEPHRRQGLLLEAGHRRRDDRVLPERPLFELRASSRASAEN